MYILALGSPCQVGVQQMMIYTKHFKGIFPESVQVETDIEKLENKQEEEVTFLCRPPRKETDVG